MKHKDNNQTESAPPKRSLLPGELGESVDRALLPGDDLIYEVTAYRGYALVLSNFGLMLVVGGVLAGLKPHEQHVLRLNLEDIADIEFIPEKTGCISPFIGPPLVQMKIVPSKPKDHDPKWDTLMVDFKMIGEAMKIAGRIKYEQGKREMGTVPVGPDELAQSSSS